MKSTVLAFTSICFAACAADIPQLSESAQLLKVGEPGVDDDGGMCPEWGCGSNSPVIELERFHELHELGQVNAQGYRILSFQKYISGAWRNYKPRVRDGVLTAWTNGGYIGTTYYPPMKAFEGGELIGMRLQINNKRTGKELFIYVDSIADAEFWVHPSTMQVFGSPTVAKTYGLRWIDFATMKYKANVCGESPDDDGITPFHAVLFEQDRIDADLLRVTGEEAGWFNIGCKGHTLAKMHLMGRTHAAGFWMGRYTSLQERTALMKMLAGDYCGNGHAFTVAGVPLQIKDSRGWYNDIDHAFGLEAKWDQNGATCLNTPRYDYQGYYGTFLPDVDTLLDTAVDGWCDDEHPRPPPCGAGTMSDPFYSGGYFISVNVPN